MNVRSAEVETKWFGVALSIMLLLGGLLNTVSTEAQEATKTPRIGFLGGSKSGPSAQAFFQGLRDLGYTEGQNVVLEYRDSEGKFERIPALAAELVARKVDVIVAGNTISALGAKQATGTIPIVFVSADAVASGLVASLARPGGNLTGLSAILPELVGKCLEYLKQAVPKVSRVAVLWQPAAYPERTVRDMLAGADGAARTLGLQLQFVEARAPADFARAFSEMTRARVDALTVLPSAMFIREGRRLAGLSAKHRLPAVYSVTEFFDAGGLMVYGPNAPDLYRRAAGYVDKILKGAQPGDLPVEQPIKFELLINVKAARAIGLMLPPSVLARADRVIDQ